MPSANKRPPSVPMSSVAKNNPPRKPLPSETIDAIAFRMNSEAMNASGIDTMLVKCSAPCPDDITCGVSSAIAPTKRPPSAGRSGGHSLIFVSSASHAATPRMMAMPNRPESSPSRAATARSRPSTSPTLPTRMPSDSAPKPWVTK